jgi:hypothetical protein
MFAKQNFAKFHENLLIFASFSLFAKMEKTVFVSTLGSCRIRILWATVMWTTCRWVKNWIRIIKIEIVKRKDFQQVVPQDPDFMGNCRVDFLQVSQNWICVIGSRFYGQLSFGQLLGEPKLYLDLWKPSLEGTVCIQFHFKGITHIANLFILSTLFMSQRAQLSWFTSVTCSSKSYRRGWPTLSRCTLCSAPLPSAYHLLPYTQLLWFTFVNFSWR